MPERPVRILVVDDDALVNLTVQGQLQNLGFEVVGSAQNGPEGVDLARSLSPDVVILDMRMPDPRTGLDDPEAGLQAARLLNQQTQVALVLLTAYESPELTRQASEAGVGAYLVKPVRDGDLERAVHIAQARQRDLRELQRMNEEMVRTNQALAHNEQIFQAISQATPMGIFLATPQGRMTFLSPGWEAITRYPLEELRGFRFLRSLHPKDRITFLDDFYRAMELGQPWTGTVRFLTRHEETKWVRIHGAPLLDDQGRVTGAAGVMDDITDRRRARELREQSQRRESLAVLAGGIAHDFNNLLTAIQGYLELAIFQTPQESPLNRYLYGIQSAVERAGDLSRQMLTFAGHQLMNTEPLALNRLIESLKPTLVGLLPPSARLHLDLQEPLQDIQGDPVQIQQVIHSLVMNAGEALVNQRGDIHLRTRTVDLDTGTFGALFPEADPHGGTFITLTVEDSGIGMDSETLARVFEPFFSTKFMGRGLGLPATQGILRAHQAHIQVESTPGQGSRFTLYFPQSTALPGTPPAPVATKSVGRTPPGGRVLLVDDEAALRESVAEFLDILGFETIQAADGAEAVERFRESTQPITLVIMDLTMPRMDGHEASKAIRAMDPEVKIVLSSGYSEQDATRSSTKDDLAAFLQKPYTLRDLESLLSRVLAIPPKA